MFRKLLKLFQPESYKTYRFWAARGSSDVWIMRNYPIDWMNLDDYVTSNKVLNIPGLERIGPGETAELLVLVKKNIGQGGK